MKSIGSLAIGAGLALVTLAMFVQGFLPAMLPESRSKQVSRAVRTDLGDVKWVRADATDYTPTELDDGTQVTNVTLHNADYVAGTGADGGPILAALKP